MISSISIADSLAAATVSFSPRLFLCAEAAVEQTKSAPNIQKKGRVRFNPHRLGRPSPMRATPRGISPCLKQYPHGSRRARGGKIRAETARTPGARVRGRASEYAELRYPNVFVTRAAPRAVEADGPTYLFRRSSPAIARGIASSRYSFARATGSSRLDLLLKARPPRREPESSERQGEQYPPSRASPDTRDAR
jgi:hypothetical protein